MWKWKLRIIKNCYFNIIRVNKVKCEIIEYGYDIWIDMLFYGDWGLLLRCYMLIIRRKKIYKILESY